jgi:hypothetical protein
VVKSEGDDTDEEVHRFPEFETELGVAPVARVSVGLFPCHYVEVLDDVAVKRFFGQSCHPEPSLSAPTTRCKLQLEDAQCNPDVVQTTAQTATIRALEEASTEFPSKKAHHLGALAALEPLTRNYDGSRPPASPSPSALPQTQRPSSEGRSQDGGANDGHDRIEGGGERGQSARLGSARRSLRQASKRAARALADAAASDADSGGFFGTGADAGVDGRTDEGTIGVAETLQQQRRRERARRAQAVHAGQAPEVPERLQGSRGGETKTKGESWSSPTRPSMKASLEVTERASHGALPRAPGATEATVFNGGDGENGLVGEGFGTSVGGEGASALAAAAVHAAARTERSSHSHSALATAADGSPSLARIENGSAAPEEAAEGQRADVSLGKDDGKRGYRDATPIDDVEAEISEALSARHDPSRSVIAFAPFPSLRKKQPSAF